MDLNIIFNIKIYTSLSILKIGNFSKSPVALIKAIFFKYLSFLETIIS